MDGIWDGVRLEVSTHAMRRYWERVDPAGTAERVRAAVRAGYPATDHEYRELLHCGPDRAADCRVVSGGVVYVVTGKGGGRCRVVTVFRAGA